MVSKNWSEPGCMLKFGAVNIKIAGMDVHSSSKTWYYDGFDSSPNGVPKFM